MSSAGAAQDRSQPADPNRVLLVDDDTEILEVMRKFLRAEGYEVTVAESGKAALAQMNERPADLVLLDLMMPNMDGFETARRIKRLPGGRDTAILFLSALHDPGSYAKANAVGADDFLSKPVKRSELLLRVHSLLRIGRMSRELRESCEALVRAQEQRRELTSFVVHDLKGPLTGIVANAQFLASEPLTPAGKEGLSDLLHSAGAMQRMVYDLLDISRSEDGSLALHPESVEIAPMVQSLLAHLGRRAEENGPRLSAAVPPGLCARADPSLLRRLLDNLVDNALKYAPRGSPICIEARALDAEWVEIAILDAGPGIPESQREQVFEKYARLDPSDGQRASSHGLGLTFCRRVAEAHGGQITVERRLPSGSCFRVRLPAR